MQTEIGFLGILVATVVSVVLGFIWFGPLFGKQWCTSIGMTGEPTAEEKKKGMKKVFFLNFISTFIMAYVMAHALVFGSTYTGISGAGAGLSAGFWNWLGFVAPVLLGGVLWEKKSYKWWMITGGYYLVALILQGIVLSWWL